MKFLQICFNADHNLRCQIMVSQDPNMVYLLKHQQTILQLYLAVRRPNVPFNMGVHTEFEIWCAVFPELAQSLTNKQILRLIIQEHRETVKKLKQAA